MSPSAQTRTTDSCGSPPVHGRSHEDGDCRLQGKIIDLFKEWDEDKNGKISKIEFRRAVATLGYEATPEQSDALFRELDKDKNGQIEYKELLVGLKTAKSKKPAPAEPPSELSIESLRANIEKNSQRTMDLFKAWDEDKNGSIDQFEFRRAIATLGFEATTEACDTLFEMLDKDDSGSIEYKELLDGLKKVKGKKPKTKSRKSVVEAAAASATEQEGKGPSPGSASFKKRRGSVNGPPGAGSPPSFATELTKVQRAAAGAAAFKGNMQTTDDVLSRMNAMMPEGGGASEAQSPSSPAAGPRGASRPTLSADAASSILGGTPRPAPSARAGVARRDGGTPRETPRHGKRHPGNATEAELIAAGWRRDSHRPDSWQPPLQPPDIMRSPPRS